MRHWSHYRQGRKKYRLHQSVKAHSMCVCVCVCVVRVRVYVSLKGETTPLMTFVNNDN